MTIGMQIAGVDDERVDAWGRPIEYVDVDVEVGVIVQSLMFRRRHRQEDLGRILGNSPATVSRKLHGQVKFSIADLLKIGRAYEVDPAELLPRLDSNQQPCDYLYPQVSDPSHRHLHLVRSA